MSKLVCPKGCEFTSVHVTMPLPSCGTCRTMLVDPDAPTDLKVFTNSEDFVVAQTVEEARAFARENIGDESDESEWNEIGPGHRLWGAFKINDHDGLGEGHCATKPITRWIADGIAEGCTPPYLLATVNS